MTQSGFIISRIRNDQLASFVLLDGVRNQKLSNPSRFKRRHGAPRMQERIVSPRVDRSGVGDDDDPTLIAPA